MLYAKDLVAFIKEQFQEDFSVGVAACPYRILSDSGEELQFLKEKVENGGEFIITQAIFDLETLKIFREKCKSKGITIPIIPGMFIPPSYKQFLNMSQFCRLEVPEPVKQAALVHKEDTKENFRDFSSRMFSQLISEISQEIPDFICFQIFTLNQFEMLNSVLTSGTVLNETQ